MASNNPSPALSEDTTWCLPNGIFDTLLFASFRITHPAGSIDFLDDLELFPCDAETELFPPVRHEEEDGRKTLSRHSYAAPAAHPIPSQAVYHLTARPSDPVFVPPASRPFQSTVEPEPSLLDWDAAYALGEKSRSHRSSISSASSSQSTAGSTMSGSSVDSDVAFFREHHATLYADFTSRREGKKEKPKEDAVDKQISSTMHQIDRLLDQLTILKREKASQEGNSPSQWVPEPPVTVMMVADTQPTSPSQADRTSALKRKTKRRSYQHSFETPDRIKEAKQQPEEAEETVLDEHVPSKPKKKTEPAKKTEKKTMKATGFGYAGRGAAPGGSWRCQHCNTDTTPMVAYFSSIFLSSALW